MTNNQILIGSGMIVAALGGSLYTYSARSEPRTVLECLDSTGARVGWADRVEECPSGSTPEKHELVDACDPPSAPTCAGDLACEPGTPGCPTPQPAEYLCCAAVSGEPDCWIVSSAVNCDGDELLYECNCGVTQPDGSTDCVAAC